jgi:hypothetical protein
MNLHTLKPAEGSTHRDGKRLGRGNSSGKVVLLPKVIKVLNHVQVIINDAEVKVVKCHCTDVYLNADLRISTVLITRC